MSDAKATPATPATKPAEAPKKQAGPRIVKATREGLVGHKTASGYVIDLVVPFIALPSVKALGRFVKVVNLKNGRSCIAIVLDVGPWYEQDDDYVFGSAQPKAEVTGKGMTGRKSNGSGIDLSERVWKQLRMEDNGPVTWEFLTI